MQAAVKIALEKKGKLTVVFPFRLTSIDNIKDAQSLKMSHLNAATDRFSLLEQWCKGIVDYEFCPEVGFVSDRIRAHTKNGNVELVVVGNGLASTISEEQTITLKQFIAELKVPFLIVPEHCFLIAA